MIKNHAVIVAVGLLLFSTVSSATACKKQIKLTTLKDVKVFQCDDGTISYTQPDNMSYEGLCGPTAGANAFHAYCKNMFVSPKQIAKKYFWDVTPGVRPDVLEAGMNRLFKNNSECMKGEWKYYYAPSRWRFLDSLHYEVRRGNGTLKRTIAPKVTATRSPVMVLITGGGKNLHWVTVVDITGYKPNTTSADYRKPECKVVYNDDAGQTTKTCLEFVTKANGVDDAWYTDVILPEYVHLVFEPIK